MATIGRCSPECGGILGACENGIITKYFFDANGLGSLTGYAPNVNTVNHVLTNDWLPHGILMVGIVHSHANGIDVPSCMDIGYGIRILQSLNTVDKFYLPIVTVVDGKFKMTCFAVAKGGDEQYICRKIDYEIVDS